MLVPVCMPLTLSISSNRIGSDWATPRLPVFHAASLLSPSILLLLSFEINRNILLPVWVSPNEIDARLFWTHIYVFFLGFQMLWKSGQRFKCMWNLVWMKNNHNNNRSIWTESKKEWKMMSTVLMIRWKHNATSQQPPTKDDKINARQIVFILFHSVFT